VAQPSTCATAVLCLSCGASSPRATCRQSFFTCRLEHGKCLSLGRRVRRSLEISMTLIDVLAMIPLLFHVLTGRTTWSAWPYRWQTVADISRCLFLLLHPAESLAWQLPAIKQLSRVAGATVAATSYCQWGSPWQKSIRIISSFVDLGDQLAVCQGAGGRCQFSGRRHGTLFGTLSDGTSKYSRISMGPPKKLAKFLARCIDNGIMSHRMRVFHRCVGTPLSSA